MPIMIFSPVANFGDQSLIDGLKNLGYGHLSGEHFFSYLVASLGSMMNGESGTKSLSYKRGINTTLQYMTAELYILHIFKEKNMT